MPRSDKLRCSPSNRAPELDRLVEGFNTATGNANRTWKNLEDEHRKVAAEWAALAKERDELRQVKQDLQRERQFLAETIRKLEPDASVYLGVGVAAALLALFLFDLVWWLGPVLMRWIGRG